MIIWFFELKYIIFYDKFVIFIFWILNSITKELINLKNLYKTSKYFDLTYNKKKIDHITIIWRNRKFMMSYFSSFKEKWNSIGNPLYSSNMPFSDYCLFQSLQRYLKETRFSNYDKMETGRNFQWIFQFTDFFRKKELDKERWRKFN